MVGHHIMKKLSHIISVSVLAILFLSGIAHAQSWANPLPPGPPSGNIFPPVNTGAVAQEKTGWLGSGNFYGNRRLAAQEIRTDSLCIDGTSSHPSGYLKSWTQGLLNIPSTTCITDWSQVGGSGGNSLSIFNKLPDAPNIVPPNPIPTGGINMTGVSKLNFVGSGVQTFKDTASPDTINVAIPGIPTGTLEGQTIFKDVTQQGLPTWSVGTNIYNSATKGVFIGSSTYPPTVDGMSLQLLNAIGYKFGVDTQALFGPVAGFMSGVGIFDGLYYNDATSNTQLTNSVLTNTGGGNAKWMPGFSLTPGGTNGDVLVWDATTGTWGPGGAVTPNGTIFGDTLYWGDSDNDGIADKWIADQSLRNDGTKIAVGLYTPTLPNGAKFQINDEGDYLGNDWQNHPFMIQGDDQELILGVDTDNGGTKRNAYIQSVDTSTGSSGLALNPQGGPVRVGSVETFPNGGIPLVNWIDFGVDGTGWFTGGVALATGTGSVSIGGPGNGSGYPAYEKFQIGDRWAFHDGGTKMIGYNTTYNGGDKYIVNAPASAIRQNADGSVEIKNALTGFGGGVIPWADGITGSPSDVPFKVNAPTIPPFPLDNPANAYTTVEIPHLRAYDQMIYRPSGVNQVVPQGQVLKSIGAGTSSGSIVWGDAFPTGGTDGQVLTWNSTTGTWEWADDTLPAGTSNGQTLRWFEDTVVPENSHWRHDDNNLINNGTTVRVAKDYISASMTPVFSAYATNVLSNGQISPSTFVPDGTKGITVTRNGNTLVDGRFDIAGDTTIGVDFFGIYAPQSLTVNGPTTVGSSANNSNLEVFGNIEGDSLGIKGNASILGSIRSGSPDTLILGSSGYPEGHLGQVKIDDPLYVSNSVGISGGLKTFFGDIKSGKDVFIANLAHGILGTRVPVCADYQGKMTFCDTSGKTTVYPSSGVNESWQTVQIPAGVNKVRITAVGGGGGGGGGGYGGDADVGTGAGGGGGAGGAYTQYSFLVGPGQSINSGSQLYVVPGRMGFKGLEGSSLSPNIIQNCTENQALGSQNISLTAFVPVTCPSVTQSHTPGGWYDEYDALSGTNGTGSYIYTGSGSLLIYAKGGGGGQRGDSRNADNSIANGGSGGTHAVVGNTGSGIGQNGYNGGNGGNGISGTGQGLGEGNVNGGGGGGGGAVFGTSSICYSSNGSTISPCINGEGGHDEGGQSGFGKGGFGSDGNVPGIADSNGGNGGNGGDSSANISFNHPDSGGTGSDGSGYGAGGAGGGGSGKIGWPAGGDSGGGLNSGGRGGNGSDGIVTVEWFNTQCADGIDNDNNGQIDFPSDSNCSDAFDDSE